MSELIKGFPSSEIGTRKFKRWLGQEVGLKAYRGNDSKGFIKHMERAQAGKTAVQNLKNYKHDRTNAKRVAGITAKKHGNPSMANDKILRSRMIRGVRRARSKSNTADVLERSSVAADLMGQSQNSSELGELANHARNQKKWGLNSSARQAVRYVTMPAGRRKAMVGRARKIAFKKGVRKYGTAAAGAGIGAGAYGYFGGNE